MEPVYLLENESACRAHVGVGELSQANAQLRSLLLAFICWNVRTIPGPPMRVMSWHHNKKGRIFQCCELYAVNTWGNKEMTIC